MQGQVSMARSTPTTPLPSPILEHPFRSTRGKSRGSFSTLLEYFNGRSPVTSAPRSRSTGRQQRASWEKIKISSPLRHISVDLDTSATSPLLSPPIVPDLSVPPPPSPLESLSPQSTMDRASMLHPDAAMVAPGREKQAKEAKDMTRAVAERAQKLGIAAPEYDFLELIGKGAFGRVFKGRRQADKAVVAVKIIDVDSSDYKLRTDEKDQAIKDFVNEASVLQTLRDSKAKNINVIHEAFSFHSQLWIISEYCPGGSIHTLMRASPGGLEESHIIAISRELAIALKYVHEAGIIHRDVKSANILITQDGQLQLCDFGVSGVLENNVAKRSTIIGTPYWMAPELHGLQADGPSLGYGTEVDCWAYGCTVFEMATGQPPNATIMPKYLGRFLGTAPRLEADSNHSDALREFVSYCLVERPEDRPDAEAILNHRYIAYTSKKYPTSSLRQLIERYAIWERSGGQRVSLWLGIGATHPTQLGLSDDGEVDEWNFSTTADFSNDAMSHFSRDVQQNAGSTPAQAQAMSPYQKGIMDRKAQRGGEQMSRLFDETAVPYEYKDGTTAAEESDLLFRRSMYSNDRHSVIDLDDARASKTYSIVDLDAADATTLRARPDQYMDFFGGSHDEEETQAPTYYPSDDARRNTLEWKFPSADTQLTVPVRVDRAKPKLEWSMQSALEEAQQLGRVNPNPLKSSTLAPPRPTLKHTVTEPIGQFDDHVHLNAEDYASAPGLSGLSDEPPDRDSMIDLDAAFATMSRQSPAAQNYAREPVDRESMIYPDDSTLNTLSRQPSTAHSFAASTPATDVMNFASFSVEPDEYNDRTVRGKPSQSDRTSLHAHSYSEPTKGDRSSGESLGNVHTRGSSLISNPEYDRHSRQEEDLQNHQRNISVQESMAQLRRESAADDYEDREFGPVVTTRLQPQIQRRGNSQHMPQEESAAGHWKQYPKWNRPRNHSVDTAPSSIISDTDDYQYVPSHNQNRTFAAPNSNGYHRPPPQSSPGVRGRRKYESDADSDANANPVNNSYPRSPRTHQRPHPGHRIYHQRVVSFPDVQPPDMAALEDDADPEMVVSELERLLDAYMQGLDAATLLMADEQRSKRVGGLPATGTVDSKKSAKGHARTANSGSGSASSRDAVLMMRS